MNPQIQGCMEKIREMVVPERKKIQLCSVLAGIENSNNEEAKLEEWYEFLDLFFNDDSILEEIYKKMKTNGLCFLNKIGIDFDEDEDKTEIFVLKHAGKHDQTSFNDWNPQIYYETNIRECTQPLMAIPINLVGTYDSHSNMLIITKKEDKKTTWEIEHFEPNGREQDNEEYDVNEEVDKLVHDILKHDPEYNKDNVKIIHPKQLCKLTTKTNKILQQILLNNTKYEGSCSIFSMWYSFNRILYPEKESEQIYKEMNQTLLSSKNPSQTIENIILSFVSLINIDINTFKIGNDRILMTNAQNKIKERKNKNLKFSRIEKMINEENPILTFSGVDFDDPEEILFRDKKNLKTKKEVHFINCVLPNNCFRWIENNKTIEVIEIVDCYLEILNEKILFNRLESFMDCANLKHLTIVGSISFKRLFNGNIIEEILNNNKQLESINFGNNGINYNVANIIYLILSSFRKLKLKSFNILDDDNADPELFRIQDEINKLLTQYNLGKGLNKTRKNKKKQQGKHKKRSTKPKTKNNYKKNI